MNKKDIQILPERYNTIKKDLIIESSLSRLWQSVQSRKPFAMLSWQRSGMSPAEELRYYSQLKIAVREMGYGYIELRGGYPEQDIEDPTKTIDVDSEMSLFVPMISLKDALKLGSVDNGFGPQDSILHSDGQSIALYSTNHLIEPLGSATMKFEYGQDSEALPMAKHAVEQYFSKLVKGSHRGKKFGFIPESFFLEELGLDRKWPKNPEEDKWSNWGIKVI